MVLQATDLGSVLGVRPERVVVVAVSPLPSPSPPAVACLCSVCLADGVIIGPQPPVL